MAPIEDDPDPITACTRCDKDHDRGSVECPARRVGTTLDGRYRLDHLIGSGGCGAVFAATHLRLGTRVAVKTLLARLARNGDLTRRFLREAQSAAGLSHPGIVKVTDFGSAEDGAPYLVMEHIAASNLGALVGRNALTPAQVASLATKILEALAAAHRAGIVHRDLKPANILYLPQAGGEAQVKIVDFGLAKVAESSDPRLTETGEFFGTPQYVSPEQLQDSKAADVRSDLYSVGAVLYFLLTGRSHVGSGTVPEILSRVLQGSFERHPRLLSPDTPLWLDAVVARSLAHDPKERFASADEMRSGILRADPEVSDPASLTLSLAPFESGRSRARRFVERSRATAALLAVMALLGLAWSRWIRSTAPVSPGAAGPGGSRMVPIAAGPFRMGSTGEEIAAAFSWCRELVRSGCDRALYEREAPARQGLLSPFAIDVTEVSNREFAGWLQTVPDIEIVGDRVVRAGGIALVDLHPAHGGLRLDGRRIVAREGHERRPVVQVTWAGARRYCEAQGKRLPTEAEWERAARGRSGARFPWGNDAPTCATAVFGRERDGPCAGAGPGTRDVGTTEGDRSEEGVLDLGGNVSEWVEDAFSARLPECPAPCRDPVVRGPERDRSCRGGNWGALAEMCRSAGRGRRAPDDVSHQIGFRCAASR